MSDELTRESWADAVAEARRRWSAPPEPREIYVGPSTLDELGAPAECPECGCSAWTWGSERPTPLVCVDCGWSRRDE